MNKINVEEGKKKMLPKKDFDINYFLSKYRNLEHEKEIELLLKNKTIALWILEIDVLTYLWENYHWAKKFIIENIEELFFYPNYCKIARIVQLSMEQKEYFLDLCNRVFRIQNSNIKTMLIDILLDLGFPATEELLIEPFKIKSGKENSNFKMEKNSIFNILEYRLDDEGVKEVFLNHYEELFESSIHEKMQILSSVLALSPKIDSPLIDKYGILLSYFKQIPPENQKWSDEILSVIVENKGG